MVNMFQSKPLDIQKNLNFYQHRCVKFLECGKFQTKVVEKIKTHILCLIIFSPEIRAVYEMCGKIW